MQPLIVQMPRVHMAGTEALHHAHLEVSSHGVALFLSPDAPLPLLDIDGSPVDLRAFMQDLSAALDATAEDARVQADASIRPARDHDAQPTQAGRS